MQDVIGAAQARCDLVAPPKMDLGEALGVEGRDRFLIEPDVEVPAEPDVSDIMQLTVTDAVPMPVDFGAMTKAQLHEACTAKGVVFRKKDTTAQLIALLG